MERCGAARGAWQGGAERALRGGGWSAAVIGGIDREPPLPRPSKAPPLRAPPGVGAEGGRSAGEGGGRRVGVPASPAALPRPPPASQPAQPSQPAFGARKAFWRQYFRNELVCGCVAWRDEAAVVVVAQHQHQQRQGPRGVAAGCARAVRGCARLHGGAAPWRRAGCHAAALPRGAVRRRRRRAARRRRRSALVWCRGSARCRGAAGRAGRPGPAIMRGPGSSG